jgi:phosphoglycolate phosphatase-like HAD superfamily hydrolase
MKKLQCTAIIFDFDGTLANSMPFLESIGVQMMRKHFGISQEDATDKYRSTTGLPYEQQVKFSFPNNPANEDAIEEFEQLKIDRIFEQELFPDSEETLQEIQSMGVDIFVSSSTFQSTIVEYFRRKGLMDYFVEILGYRPGFEKGADHFEYVSKKYGIPLDELVFVGDSLKDYERSTGYCGFIAISRMFSEEEFRKMGHEGPVVDDLLEVLDHLEKI